MMNCWVYFFCVCKTWLRNGNNSIIVHCMVSMLEETVQKMGRVKVSHLNVSRHEQLQRICGLNWSSDDFLLLSCKHLAHLDFGVSLEDRKFFCPLAVILIRISNLLLGVPTGTPYQHFKLHLAETKLSYPPCKPAPLPVSPSLTIIQLFLNSARQRDLEKSPTSLPLTFKDQPTLVHHWYITLLFHWFHH